MSEAGARGPRAGAAIERWTLPEVEGPLAGRNRGERAAAPGESASEEARGYQAGLARAQAQMQTQLQELDTRVRRLDAVLQHLALPLDALDAEVQKELLQLAMAIGRQLARRELQADPTQVVAIVRECLELLPVGAREVRVQLHPLDAACVRERLAAPAEERAWTLIEDPTLARGGCMVASENSQIDARFESRVNAVIAAALGEQRSAERAPQDGEPE